MKTNYTLSVRLQNKKKFRVLFILLVMTCGLSSQVTYTFTPCGAQGAVGPTQLQVNNTYTPGNSLNGSVTVSGQGIQQFTVPVTGNYRIEARGARGYSPSGVGGRGATISGDFSLTVGAVLKIAVGQEGQVNPAAGTLQFGGGGGSFVSLLNNTPLLVAGGGGGSHATSYVASTADGTVSNNGNSGAGTAAGAGGVGGGGGAASSSANGGAGFYGDGGGTTGPALSFTNGALGGNVGAVPYANGAIGGFGGGGGTQSWNNNRGGGGGGYSGGGGGQLGQPNCWGGGGGSYNIGTNQTNLSGANTSANGVVIITRLCNITLGTSSGITSICQGAAVTLTTDAISSYTWSTGSNASAITVSPNVTTTYTLTAMSPSLCITNAATTITVSSGAPSLTVTPTSNSVCLGNTVSILASGALTYTFSGGISNGLPFAPSVNTTYTIQGQNGCGTSTSLTTISIAPLPVVGIVSPTVVCAASAATLSGGGATNYTWQPGGIVGANVIVSPLASTVYTVTGETGACIGTYTVGLVTNPTPTVVATTSSLIICAGASVTLTATGANSYTWQPMAIVASSVVVAPTTPTIYFVTGVNSFNCSSTISQPVVVNSSPTVNVSTNNPNICSGSSATLTASGANAYVWSNGPVTNINVVNPSGTSVYTVVGTNTTTQCTDTKTIQVSVFVATIAVTNPTGVCIGSSVTINASGANTYNWSNGSTGSSIVVSPLTATGYTVNGVSAIGNGTCASIGSASIAVNQLPVITATSLRTFICKNEKAIINAGGGVSYLWNTLSTAASLTVSPQINTGYTVTGTDINECKSVASITISVSNCVGLEDLSNTTQLIVVYPNPNQGEFKLKAEQGMDVTLMNELGQILRSIKLNDTNGYEANVSDLPNGVYFITGQINGNTVNQKIIIQK